MRMLVVGLALAIASPALADGNVTTTAGGDEITITGDDEANAFDVKVGTDDMGNDVLVIEGRNGTTINGEARWEIPLQGGRIKYTKLTVDPRGGNDDAVIDLGGLPDAKRFVEVGVDGSAGDDTATVRNVQTDPKGKVRVETWGGTDSSTVENCDTTNLNVKSESPGSINVRGCNVRGRLRITTAEGDAEVTVEDCFYQSQDIKAGKSTVAPSRAFRQLRNQGGKISLDSGDGDDEIVFEDNVVESVSVKAGGGNDLVSFTGSSFGKSRFDGGAGEDCFDDMQDQNAFGSFKEKGFEPAACNGAVELDWFVDVFSDPEEAMSWPEDAVAWRTVNPANGHVDGPFALPGQGAALGLPERDPSDLAPPAHWGLGPECAAGPVEFFHPHDAWEGHGDPDEDGCGHGILEWGRLAPI